MDEFISGQKIGGQELIGGLDCTVHRNLFGSQVMSTYLTLNYEQSKCIKCHFEREMLCLVHIFSENECVSPFLLLRIHIIF